MRLPRLADAVAFLFSEETGTISICVNGVLQRKLNKRQFRERNSEALAESGSTEAKQPPHR